MLTSNRKECQHVSSALSSEDLHERCLDKSIEFKKAHPSNKIRIGFNHWYHKGSSASSDARKMAESTGFGDQ
jgi:hypothetical protein